jgi:hypothetical protein
MRICARERRGSRQCCVFATERSLQFTNFSKCADECEDFDQFVCNNRNANLSTSTLRSSLPMTAKAAENCLV